MLFAMILALPLPLVPIQILMGELSNRWTAGDGAWTRSA